MQRRTRHMHVADEPGVLHATGVKCSPATTIRRVITRNGGFETYGDWGYDSEGRAVGWQAAVGCGSFR